MKVWTYLEMKTKVINDLDLQDETFIKADEYVGYFNEALTESESEMLLLNQDYFLTKFYLHMIVGRSRFALPANIFANKIRGIMYSVGSLIYKVPQVRRKDKFDLIAMSNQYGVNDEYAYFLTNDRPGQAVLNLLPPSREAAVLSPVASLYTPLVLWYLRNCARVPVIGEYCNPEIILPSQINTVTNQIQTYSGVNSVGTIQQGLPGGFPGSILIKTGDQVKFSLGPDGTMPTGIVAETVYFAIADGSGLIRIASTLALALAGTALPISVAGTVYTTLSVCATTAIQNATLIDIPEFATFVMQWVKCRCMEKEGDPRLEGAVLTLEKQRKQLNDTLVTSIDDDDDTIQADMSFYNEMS